MAQNYSNHKRYVPLYHFFLGSTTAAVLVGAFVNLFKSYGTSGLYSASLIVVLAINAGLAFYFLREFALRAQDRAIRAEENLRHFAATGKLLDPRLDIRQIIGLRFAGDDEFVALAQKAAETGMSKDEIKRAIKNWRPDDNRA